MAEPITKIVTVGGIARELGVSGSAVRKWERQGSLPEAIRLSSGQRVWVVAEIAPALERIAERRAARSAAA